MMTPDPIDALIASCEATLARQSDPVVTMYRVDVEELLVQIKSLCRNLRLSEASRGVLVGRD